MSCSHDKPLVLTPRQWLWVYWIEGVALVVALVWRYVLGAGGHN